MTSTLDEEEVRKFSALAGSWWDRDGPSRVLHDLNPVRSAYIAERAPLAGATVLDVGCGGGLLCESLARAGARVTGLDPAAAAVEVARAHAAQEQLAIEYFAGTIEDFAEGTDRQFDVLTCMELLEHVPEPAELIGALAALSAPGGRLFLSTLNRRPRAWASAILGAEYIAGLLPRGTHDYARFIRPSELAAWLRQAGFELRDIRGLAYDPLRRRARLVPSPAVNYLVHAERTP